MKLSLRSSHENDGQAPTDWCDPRVLNKGHQIEGRRWPLYISSYLSVFDFLPPHEIFGEMLHTDVVIEMGNFATLKGFHLNYIKLDALLMHEE